VVAHNLFRTALIFIDANYSRIKNMFSEICDYLFFFAIFLWLVKKV
jgi:hypothetical protein